MWNVNHLWLYLSCLCIIKGTFFFFLKINSHAILETKLNGEIFCPQQIPDQCST